MSKVPAPRRVRFNELVFSWESLTTVPAPLFLIWLIVGTKMLGYWLCRHYRLSGVNRQDAVCNLRSNARNDIACSLDLHGLGVALEHVQRARKCEVDTGKGSDIPRFCSHSLRFVARACFDLYASTDEDCAPPLVLSYKLLSFFRT